MLIQLVEAAHDERGGGNYAYGIPGDQTGAEVRLRNAVEGEFTSLLRYPNKTMAKHFAEDALEIAMNDHIGYAQYGYDTLGGRYGLHEVMKAVDRFQDIKTDCNCDCSSLVGEVLRHNGLNCGLYMRTATERNELANLGFIEVPYTLDEARLGDVCWREGHTAIIVRAPEQSDKGEDMNYSVVVKSSKDQKKWSTGAGPLTRECPYVTVRKSDIGFTPNVICIQQVGEILANSQWMRGQAHIYVANYENNAYAGVAAGKAKGYFNPDAETIIIPVRFPEKEYLVKVYS